jgi:membrane-associated phospholipid phosphatase
MLQSTSGTAGAWISSCAVTRRRHPAIQSVTPLRLVLCAALLALSAAAQAARATPDDATEPQPPVPAEPENATYAHTLLTDAKAYFTAPLRWDAGDWGWFAGSLAAIGAAHHYDTQVRTHFIKTEGPTVGSKSYDLQDALPAVAALGATWVWAGFTDSSAGHREASSMLEAASLSSITTTLFKFTVRREDPYQTSNPNEWEKSGGASFPSTHSSAAFAIGTVLAESGNDDVRWIRRLLGYGLGAATAYERLKHNAHWLSDTVAGAAVGISSAHFVMNRHETGASGSSFALVPVPGGAMLTYQRNLD